jgi:predicted phosphodiesterase
MMKIRLSLAPRLIIYVVVLLSIGIWITHGPALVEQANLAEPRGVTLIGGPMIQVGDTDGKSAIAIVWRTAELSTSRVDYGPTPALGSRIVDHGLTRYHALVLRNLKPSSRYHYRVSSNHQVLSEAVVQTGKAEGEPFRFAVFGDSGSGKTAQYELAKLIEQHQVDMILHTGDVAYPEGKEEAYAKKFYLPYKRLLERIPIFPVLGNHDYETKSGQPWVDNFFLPGAERFYSFDYGNAHFTALDSYRIDAASARWLEHDLAKTDKRWKFVFFHEPPFSNKDGRTGSAGARNLWLPLLEKYRIDLVFSGHDHLYTRFKARRGVIYIVEGVGGYTRYKINKAAAHVEFTDNSEFGFGLVEVAGPELIFRHITATGKTLDTLRLTKQPQHDSPAG